MTPEERNQLVEDNLGLATHFAQRFCASHMEFEDLVQEACLGLMEAAEKFDPDRGNKFSTYARWLVLKHVMNAIHTRNDIVRTPRRHTSISCGSLDLDLEDRPALADSLVSDEMDPADALDHANMIDAVRDCIGQLDWREAAVIRMRYGVNTDRLTLAQVGNILDITQERVRQIQRGAERKLRSIALGCATLHEHGAATAGHQKEPAQPENETNQ